MTTDTKERTARARRSLSRARSTLEDALNDVEDLHSLLGGDIDLPTRSLDIEIDDTRIRDAIERRFPEPNTGNERGDYWRRVDDAVAEIQSVIAREVQRLSEASE